MIIVRGSRRVADIYFTEFNRIFNHYYFRAVVQQFKDRGIPNNKKSFFLEPGDKWIGNYKVGSLKRKRVNMFIQMKNAITLA